MSLRERIRVLGGGCAIADARLVLPPRFPLRSPAVPLARRPVASVALLVALAPASAAGSPLEMFGFGGRAPALAGAGLDSQAYDATYLNPAGLAGLRHRHVAIGYHLGDIDLDVDGREQPSGSPLARTIGAALPLPLGGALRDRVGIGFGVVTPSGTLVKVQAPRPGQPYFPLLANRARVISIKVGVGVALTPDLALGAGLVALAGLRGSIFVDADGSGRITTNSEHRVTAHYAGVLGARWARDRLRLAAVLRTASQVRYDVDVTNDLADELPLALPELRIAGVGQYDPLTVALEGGYQVGGGLSLLAQLAWQDWSRFPLPTENPLASAEPQAAPGFHDTFVPRVAAEWRRALGATLVSARAGYAFAASPAPEASGPQSFLDNSRHIIAGGVGLARPDTTLPLHLDLWLQLHALVPRRHTKDRGALPPDEMPAFDSLDTGGHMLIAGAILGVDL